MTTDNEMTAWRERNKLSQRQAAIVLGCSRNAWMQWEGGVHRVPRYILLALSALSGRRIKQILSEQP